MIDRPIEPNIETADDIDTVSPIGEAPFSTELPRRFQEELPPLSDTRQVVLTGTGTPATDHFTFPKFDEEIDGWLVYVVQDVAANQANRILVSNSPTTGDSNDDILTPGKAVLIMYQGNFISVRNMSANPHTVVVKAFRGWLPVYF